MGNLYETIVALCNQRGIRPGRLCDELKLSRGLMTDLKMGRKKSVSAETAQRIASYFGVSVAYLLGQQEEDVLEQVDIAFYGEYKELDEEQKETARKVNLHMLSCPSCTEKVEAFRVVYEAVCRLGEGNLQDKNAINGDIGPSK